MPPRASRRTKRKRTGTSEEVVAEPVEVPEPVQAEQAEIRREGPAPEDVLNVLVATDMHVGFMEKDRVRGEDSFEALEEVLKLAVEKKVDFLLLGGDLFHDHKPSRHTTYRVMELFRRYCFGDGDINFQIVSEQQAAIGGGSSIFRRANYEDPNVNVALPVFSIHGNHDDPSGDPSLAALDLLSAANLLNYFGKSDRIDDITINPILITKGSTKLAMYGLGYLRDERLNRTFQAGKVTLLKPSDTEQWFHLFVIHQNRVNRNPRAVIRESMIPSFMDFVVWGHEHESRIDPEWSAESQFSIVQPGSTVATTLAEDEAKPKHAGLLSIRNDGDGPQFRFKALPLKSVRPFVIKAVTLSKVPVLQGLREDQLMIKIEEYLTQQVNSLLTDDDSGKLPLIRLKVDHTGFPTVHTARFGQQFVDKVANPNEILLFHKQRAATTRARAGQAVEEAEPADTAHIEDLIEECLKNADAALEILPEGELTDALTIFVEKDDAHAIETRCEGLLHETQEVVVKETTRGMVDDDVIKRLVSAQMDKKRQESQGVVRTPVTTPVEEEVVQPTPPRKRRKR